MQNNKDNNNNSVVKRVWSNIVLRRLICSKIGECIPVSEENRIKLKANQLEMMRRYKRDPVSFIDFGNSAFYRSPFMTARMFEYHYDHYHSIGARFDYRGARQERVLDGVAGNPRNMIDTWLFRRAYDHLKRRGVKPEDMASVETWRYIVSTNNVELYNYAKSVLPMPKASDCASLLPITTKPALDFSYHVAYIIKPLDGTELLAALLDDLYHLDPNEKWLGWIHFGGLVARGRVDVLQTIETHAGPYISREINVLPVGEKRSYTHCHSHLTQETMRSAIQNKQIEAIRFLYKVSKIPIGPQSLIAVARTCDLPFLIALHNIEPEAGRLYTLFLHVMSSAFFQGPLLPPTQWKDFQQEFYQLGKKLNYIDTNLQHQIDTKQPIRYRPKNIQQHFKIFESNNTDLSVPSLSFSFSDGD
ncbi:hypothetical protein DFA_00179 [Cavenderia fasciculata]|uniref:Uncharacterized protein n=1 Tax=Cavenderia fasciculata TaxID=261658 RepID=F4PXU1_CACFS|nr:uncharacterized protein DFA_00179 [Cavenderia fasciculata]EGG19601.1 hypothetical protein DFA_00179 [Cavenderia fasciculata]|eukprot:XP_004357895.1 hypothetical protein DFA_00179 [Cavenderia fasciculata]